MSKEPILIVGAGPAGCTLALLLAKRGVPTVVLERRNEPLLHPAAHVINARSMEIWREASPPLAERIAALSPQPEEISVIRWSAGLDKEPLGEIDLVRDDPKRVEMIRSHSPYLISHIGQHLLMPVLWEALEDEPLVDLRRGVNVTDVKCGADSVRITTLGHGAFEGSWAIAADGANSSARQAAGVTMEGKTLARMGSVFFHAPSLFPGPNRPLLTWIYQPEFCGVLIAHADDDYILMTAYLHEAQAIAADSGTYWSKALPKVIGSMDDVTVRSYGTWEMTSQLADSFRAGRLLFIGDAAHRFPHTGGFGLNSGVQDAQNVAWKLAAVLSGQAEPALMDTYEAERRPVITRFAEQSVSNHFLLDTVTKPVGVTNRSLHHATEAFARAPFTWVPGSLMARVCTGLTTIQMRRTALLAETGRRAQRVTAKVRAAIPEQLEHFASTGLEFGYTYAGPLVAAERSPQPSIGDGVVDYLPTTWPGARLPHAIIGAGEVEGPLCDALSADGLTLITADSPAWTKTVDAVAEGFNVRVLELRAAQSEAQESLISTFEVGVEGAVLVRPDGHVVWRTAMPAHAGRSGLERYLEEHWGQYFRAGSWT
jgi:2,4-dichlorophenol 6-monooxygenase